MNIYIITPNGLLRNKLLNESFPNGIVISGFDGRKESFDDHFRIDQISNSLVIGRKLSSTQSAAVLSHNKAQTESTGDWFCILEDDALVLDLEAFRDALKLISGLNFRKPTVILLYAGYGGSYKKFKALDRNFSLSKISSLPTGAVGYIMNSKCRDLIKNERKIVGAPDWPTWSSKANFLQLYPAIVNHSWEFKKIYSAISLKTDPISWPEYRKSIRGLLKGILNSKITSAFGGRQNYFYSVIKPSIYKRLNNVRKFN